MSDLPFPKNRISHFDDFIEEKPMNRVLFLIPPYFNAEDYLCVEKAAVLPAFTVPYGILSLDAYVRKYARQPIVTEICDLNVTLNRMVAEKFEGNFKEAFQSTIEPYLQDKPMIVGISALFSSSAQYIKDLVDRVKRYNPKIITVAGGGLPSADFERMLKMCPDLDAVCIGEGERPLLELLESEDPYEVLARHPNWISQSGPKKRKVPLHSFVEDLDDIPFFDYGRIDLSFYNERSINKRIQGEIRREMSIHTSRGCPFHCVFCSNPSLHGRKVRVMSVPRVISDVKRMKSEYGMTDLMIEDDHFFHDIDRATEILRQLARLDIRIEFPNGVAVYAINDEVASLLSEAGVSVVALAVESGSKFVLNRIIKKPLLVDSIKPAIESLRRHNVGVHVFVVIGLPGENDRHRAETVDMLLENDFDWVHAYLAVPIVGSRLYDICIENGYIDSTAAEDYVVTKSVIRAPGIDPEKLEPFAYETQLRVNFVENSNIENKRYEIAIKYMENVCNKYPGHAFGHHYLAHCYAQTGRHTLAESHRLQAERIFTKDPFWSNLRNKYILGQFDESSSDHGTVCRSLSKSAYN
jgi:anaerobic magnesium-protoporphyrin IX monomethyl ester cyclase